MSQLKERLTKITERPMVAHLLRANKRFGERLGNQFGAAITYFSVLAIVPIIMLGFSALGFILVTAAPQLLDEVLGQVNSALSGFDKSTRESINNMIETALRNYKAIGIVGGVSALYSGAGWMGNLKNAVRAQWRESFDVQVKKQNFILNVVSNIIILIGMLILVAITFALASVSTSLSDNIIGWLGLDSVGWLHPVLQLVPIVISIGAGWLIFMFLYLVLPETREPWHAVRRGALIGAIGLGILQYLTSFLIGKFTGNPAAALFGPVIALMLFLNLFARLILFVAAWIGTAEHPAEPEYATEEEQANASAESPSRPESVDDERVPAGAHANGSGRPVSVGGVSVGHGVRSARGVNGAQGAGGSEDSRGPWSSTPGLIPEQLAARSVQAGTRVGYLIGAATGVGAGSALTRFLMRRRARG
ncbi:tRNA-processing ribonuclease [Microlunatus elymi]|uniref:tRNA-processing ribonuclease n=1 Tax=Microlunatus elymi TaxID=2596828 RepID=A0A516PZT3_9ACTN|nr:YhjD/YihY/BrkB family envelope integrity protein [Microlunatus elymi]QDP96696.1 tRNA-processing ribonuclease [Microlunatus elymi]